MINRALTIYHHGYSLELQNYDELILEVPDSEVDSVKANLAQLMTSIVSLSVKMAVDIKVAQNWDAAH